MGRLSAYRYSVYGAVHLRKAGRFPAISDHHWKVEFRRCTQGTPSELLWLGFTFSICLSTFGRWMISRENCAPSEGEDGLGEDGFAGAKRLSPSLGKG